MFIYLNADSRKLFLSLCRKYFHITKIFCFMKQKKDFDSMGLPPFDGKFKFTMRECDLLRMSLKVCYSHFKTLSDFYEPSNSYLCRVNDEILESINVLYRKIYYGDQSFSEQAK